MDEKYQESMARAVKNDSIVKQLSGLIGITYEQMQKELEFDANTGYYLLPSGYTYENGRIVSVDWGGADAGRNNSNQFFYE